LIIAARLYTELHKNIHLYQSLEASVKKITKKNACLKKQIQTLKSKQFKENHKDNDQRKVLTESIELTKGRICAREQSLAQMRRQQNSFITSMAQIEEMVERLKMDLRQVENHLYQAKQRSQNETRKTQEADEKRKQDAIKHARIMQYYLIEIKPRILSPYELMIITQKMNEVKAEIASLDSIYESQRDLKKQCTIEDYASHACFLIKRKLWRRDDLMLSFGLYS